MSTPASEVINAFENKELWDYYARSIQEGLSKIIPHFRHISRIGNSHRLENGSIVIFGDYETFADDTSYDIVDFYNYFQVRIVDDSHLEFIVADQLLQGTETKLDATDVYTLISPLVDILNYGQNKCATTIKEVIDSNKIVLDARYQLLCESVSITYREIKINDPTIYNVWLNDESQGYCITARLKVVDLLSINPSLYRKKNNKVEYKTPHMRFTRPDSY